MTENVGAKGLEAATCDHGITFDEAEVERLYSEAKHPPGTDPAVAFIMGNPAVAEVRRRWPRGWFTPEKPCPKCGFVGIAYASRAHYAYGDW